MSGRYPLVVYPASGTPEELVELPAGEYIAEDALPGGSVETHEAADDPHPQYATPADVSVAVAALVDSSPAALDTLNELAAALGDDPNFAATVMNALAAKLDDSQATAAGLALLGAEDVAAQRSTLGLANHQLVSVDASGNLGLGMTPNGWHSAFKALELGYAGNSIFAGSLNTLVTQNAYYDGFWRYGANGAAGHLELVAGFLRYKQAIAGAANDVITWADPLTVTNGGRLLVNTQTDDGVNIAQFNGGVKAVTYSANGNGPVTLNTSDGWESLSTSGYKQFPNMSGMVLVNNYETGFMALYLCGSGGVALVSQHGTMPGTMAYDASVNGYRFTSNYAGDSTYNFMVFKTRGAA